MIELLLPWTLKASVILLAAFAVTGAMRRSSAAARHFVWTLALAGVLVLPVLGAVLPAWQVDAVPSLLSAPPAAAPDAEPLVELQFRANEREAGAVPPGSSRYDVKPAVPRIDWHRVLPLVWTVGAGLVLLRLAAGLLGVWWLARRATMMTDARWLHAAYAIAGRLGLGRGVTLLQGDRGTVPMTWGVLQPVVWLPADAEAWDDERRVVVLAHELAHVRRRDALTQWIAHLALMLNWFNPLVWIAVKRFRDERERACDDAVLELGTRPSVYADHLLDIVRTHGVAGGPMPALAMARRSQFEGRLLAILNSAAPRGSLGVRGACSAGALALAAVLPIAALSGARADEETVRVPAFAGVSPDSGRAGGVGLRLDSSPQAAAAQAAPSGARLPVLTGDTTLRRVIASAAAMTSDGDKSDVLRAVLRHPRLDRGDVAAVLLATRSMTSDGDRADVLRDALPHVAFDVREHRDAFFGAVKRFASDGDRSDILVAVADRGRLEPALLLQVIEATEAIASDGDHARVLLAVAEKSRLDDAARAAYLSSAEKISSDGDRRVALSAILPVAGEASRARDTSRSMPVAVTSAESRVVSGTRRWTTSLALNGTHDARPSYEVRIEADRAIVSADATRLLGLERGGSLEIEHTAYPGGDEPGLTTTTTRFVRITSKAGGGLERRYRVNGTARAWDADADAWLGRVVARWAGGRAP